MRFLPYDETSSVPNIIVDGPRNRSTVLALSHWARSGTPPELRADTSTEIVFRYLDTPSFRVDAEAVSNNHFDEDGLLGIYALLNPLEGERQRDLIIDAARAGDFDVYRRRDAARIAFVLGAFSSADTSPLPAPIFSRPHPEQTAELYVEILKLLPQLLADPGAFRQYWEGEDALLAEREALMDRGVVSIEERPQLDLAVVRVPEGAPPGHRAAIHSRTALSRIATIKGASFEFYYRYETWVQLASRTPLLRVDLAPLVEELNHDQSGPGRWVCDRVDALTPRLRFEGGTASARPDDVLKKVEHRLRTGEVALNPYE